MKRKCCVKRSVCLLTALVLLMLSAAACGPASADPSPTQADSFPAATQTAEAQAAETDKTGQADEAAESRAAQGETFLFTDSAGREVELPKTVTRVASGGSLANIMIYAVRPDVIVGWSEAPSETEKKYIDEAYWDLSEYGNFHDDGGGFNREALMLDAPEVIIDVGQWDEEYKAELDALQEQIGIPVVLIESQLEQVPAAYRTMGELLGVPERGEELAAYCEELLADAKEKAASIPDSERTTVFYASGEAGLDTMLSGTIHAQIYELVGARLVATADNVQVQKGGGSVSMEQLLVWDPDVIMFAQDSIYGEIAGDETWGALSAVQNGTYYEIPTEPYNWLGRPPGPNRMVGIRWLGNLLYPEIFDYDIEEEVRECFRLFYRYELSDEELYALLSRSTLKDRLGQ